MIGIYPRRDKIYQKFHIAQLLIARNRISHFPALDEIFHNFKDYENLLYKQSRNKIFLEFTIKPVDPWLFDDESRRLAKLKNQKNHKIASEFSHLFFDNVGNYPDSCQRLEQAINVLVKPRWNIRNFKELINRLTNYDYFTSNSAFSEIMMAHDIGEIVGFENVLLNPPLSSGKNGDISVKIGNRSVYLELTKPTQKESEKKIQRIFDDLAEYVGVSNKEKTFSFSIYVDTLSLLLDENGNIDEENSKKLLREWVDKLFLHKLIGHKASFYLGHDYSWIVDKKYVGDLYDEKIIGTELGMTLRKQPELLDWAKCVKLHDLNSSPFKSFGCAVEGNGPHVEVHGNSSYPSPAGLVEEKSFLNKIRKSINDKIKNEQFEKGQPIIIVLNVELWSNSFEHDYSDFLKIKPIIESELYTSQWISGVLIYSSHYTNGRYIENINANKKIMVSLEELNRLRINVGDHMTHK